MFSLIFGPGVDFHVFDTTAPDAVGALNDSLEGKNPFFIVSTKSGGTVETLSLFRYFFDSQKKRRGGAGQAFAAITDPGSTLAETAARLNFRKTFLNPPDVGGRFSALSLFGLVPACIGGVDVSMLLAMAKPAMDACLPGPPALENPGAALGAAIGEAARLGLDKLTFHISPRIASFGNWLEQLIAESTGKEGRGILPVVGERPGGHYGDDRFFVFIELEGEEFPEEIPADISGRGHPVARIKVRDIYGLGEQIYIWEMAVAVAGSVLGINPFDQPDVESTKGAARSIAAEIERGTYSFTGNKPSVQGISVAGGKPGDPAAALNEFITGAGQGSYICIQAYLAPSREIDMLLGQFRELIRERTGVAVTCGYGPRYLHSTGQLHKGDAGKGLFIQLSADPKRDIAVPGSNISFGALTLAAVLGDRKALADAGRRVIGLHFEDEKRGLEYMLESLRDRS